MNIKFNNQESKQEKKFISMRDVFKMGQMQYVSRFVNPNPKLHEDGTPYFDDIRIKGNPDDYHELSIHEDDIRKFAEKWLEYKKSTSPFYEDTTVDSLLNK
jgi:hypothetical protein